MAAKGYIVRRILHEGHNGVPDTYAYFKVAAPNPGELIYHGQFAPRKVENDMKELGMTYDEVYVPLNESALTSEPFTGGADVETF